MDKEELTPEDIINALVPPPMSKDPYSSSKFWGLCMVEAWTKSREKFGLLIDILLWLSAFLLFVFAWYSKHHPQFDKTKENDAVSYWLAIIPAALWIAWFLYHVPKASYKIYREQYLKHVRELKMKDDEIAYFSEQLQAINEVKPFEVQASVDAKKSKCYFHIQNLNRGSHSLRLKLIRIEPPMKGPHELENSQMPWPYGRPIYYSDDINLGSAQFYFTDSDGFLNQGEICKIGVFTISKGEKTTTLILDGKWPPGEHNLFIGEGEHILTFQLLSPEISMTEHKLKITFSRALERGWTVQKIL